MIDGLDGDRMHCKTNGRNKAAKKTLIGKKRKAEWERMEINV